jgi:hypothetical protein
MAGTSLYVHVIVCVCVCAIVAICWDVCALFKKVIVLHSRFKFAEGAHANTTTAIMTFAKALVQEPIR